MSRLIARLILAMLILPVSGAIFVFGFAAIVSSGGPPSALALTLLYGFLYAFVGAYWILLWRSLVRWTLRRVTLTALAAGVAMAVAVAAGASVLAVIPSLPREAVVLMGGGLVPIVWVLATVLIWRESASERIERLSLLGRDAVSCPLCGYNMTGLTEARCPECGGRFTLDQLVAAHPARDEASIEAE